MAALHRCGWELQESGLWGEWDSINEQAPVTRTIDTTVKHSGLASCKFVVTAAGGTERFDMQFLAANSNNGHFASFYFRVDVLPTADTTILLLTPISAAVNCLSFALNTDGKIELWDKTAQIGSDSAALSLGVWYKIEGYFKNNTVSGKAELTGRINGVNFATTTTSVNTGGVGRMFIGVFTANNITCYFDDFALNDDQGASETTWPNTGGLVYLRPNANGDNAPTSGGFGSIDETPPNDDTDYTTQAANNTADYNLDSPVGTGIGVKDTINCVLVGLRTKAQSGTSSITPRIKSQASGTVTSGTAISQADATLYRNNSGAVTTSVPGTYKLVSYTDPQNAGAWTRDLLATAQIGAIQSAAVATARYTAMWCIVDYLPANSSIKDPVLNSGVVVRPR